MKKLSLPPSLILLILLSPAPQAWGTHPPPSLTCADKSVVAGAVRTTEDVEAFVQCAYEFVQEVGFAGGPPGLSRGRALEKRPTYVFVAELTPVPGEARATRSAARPVAGRDAVGVPDRRFRR